MTRIASLALAVVLLSFISTLFSPDNASRYTAAATTTSYLMCDPELGDCSTSAGDHGDTASRYNDPDMEMLMDSEISRRILASSSRYISYGALSRNRVPCSTAGRSYYNCGGSGRANPYSRGCSRITRCYRDTS